MSEKLYSELASWFHLLTAPEDYAVEAETYRRVLVEASASPVDTLLEIGSGGGNNASHLKAHFRMTLVDRSPQMLAASRALNPECEHLEGDMRSVRLGRLFDAVFIHDAIAYVTAEDDLRSAHRDGVRPLQAAAAWRSLCPTTCARPSAPLRGRRL